MKDLRAYARVAYLQPTSDPMPALRRTDLQSRALTTLDSARRLVDQQRWSDAYHLAGYAVELGLKACIARQFSAEAIPDKDLLRDLFTHDINRLVGVAGLRQELKDEQDRNSEFATNWGIVGEWSTDSRYDSVDPTSAQLLVKAIDDATSGVLRWIKTFW